MFIGRYFHEPRHSINRQICTSANDKIRYDSTCRCDDSNRWNRSEFSTRTMKRFCGTQFNFTITFVSLFSSNDKYFGIFHKLLNSLSIYNYILIFAIKTRFDFHWGQFILTFENIFFFTFLTSLTFASKNSLKNYLTEFDLNCLKMIQIDATQFFFHSFFFVRSLTARIILNLVWTRIALTENCPDLYTCSFTTATGASSDFLHTRTFVCIFRRAWMYLCVFFAFLN